MPSVAAGPATGRMTADYAVLLNRSIFLKGRQVTARGSGVGGGNAGSTGVAPTTLPVAADAPRPEGHLVLNGVTLVGAEKYAFVEDAPAGKVTKVRVGERIASGKVSAITFDAIDYDSNGKVTRVNIGQNLNGVQAAPPSTRPAGADASASGGGTAPAPPAGGPGDDMLARLRARRQQELGGK